MRSTGSTTFRLTFYLLALSFLLIMGGCAEMNFGGSSADEPPPPAPAAAPAATPATDSASASSQPYYPTDFKDLLIPGELTWNRDKSMSIRTASFAGGILNFSGRVEVNSLTDFFIVSMVKDGWKLTGSVKQKSNLIVFTKPHKACMITISEGDFGIKTQVYAYVTEDIAADGNTANGAPAEEVFR